MSLDKLDEDTLSCFSDEILIEIKRYLKDETEKVIGTVDKILEERSKK